MAPFRLDEIPAEVIAGLIVACIIFYSTSMRAWVRGRYDSFLDDWQSRARIIVQDPALHASSQDTISFGHFTGIFTILGGVYFLLPSSGPWFINALGACFIGLGFFNITFAKFEMACNEKAWMWVASRKRRKEDREDPNNGQAPA